MMACWRKPFAASRPGSAWCRSPATGCSRPPSRAPSCMRSTPAARGCRLPRSRPIADMMRSCSMCRNFSTSPGPFCNPPARRAASPGPAADMTLQQQVLPLGGLAPDDPGHYRGDHLLVAQMVERGSKVLDVGCGDGDLLQLLESRGIDGRGIELSREGVNRCVSKGL